MIRPLRRGHRWLVPLLALTLLAVALISTPHRRESATMERLPAALSDERLEHVR